MAAFKILAFLKILAFQNPEAKNLAKFNILADFKIELKILAFQNIEFKILGEFKILAFQNLETQDYC